MLTLYFSATVMRCMQESVASELAARMTAMQSASNNAKKIVNTLSQVYNRARQATVTQELLEIVDRFTDRKIDELNKEKNKISEYIIKTMASYKYAKSLTLFGSDTQVLDVRHMLFRRLSVVSNINYSLNL